MTKFIGYFPNQRPSTLDHIVTNEPGLFDNLRTFRNLISDHCTITCNLKDEVKAFRPRYKIIRDYKKLTIDSLQFSIQKNIKLQNLLEEQDRNVVANTLSEEINSIIYYQAPSKRVQVTTKHEPYLTEHLRDCM